jgi:hypothetical protein
MTQLITILNKNESKKEEQIITKYAELVEYLCTANKSCENCLGMEYKGNMPSCSFVDGLVENSYEILGERPNREIENALGYLKIYSAFEALDKKYPNQKKVLTGLKQLKAVLSGKVLDEENREIKMPSVELETYPFVSVSRRAAQLLK